jgi:hypothetical protein
LATWLATSCKFQSAIGGKGYEKARWRLACHGYNGDPPCAPGQRADPLAE